jgi:hypothetical protein
MLPVIELPEIVRHYTPWFEELFADQETLIQFQRYLSGLLVCENKTVEGINRLVVYESRNQSTLNRLLTEERYNKRGMNAQRLALLESLAGTRMKPKRGALSLDDTLLCHYGREFEHIACLWDSAENRWVWAHNLVNLHYSDDKTDYPVYFQLWKPADLEQIEVGLQDAGIRLRSAKFVLKESAPKKWRQYLLGVWSRHQAKPEVAALYQSKLFIGRQLLCQYMEEHPDCRLPVTFDNWYTQPAFCRFLTHELELAYVGTLAGENELVLRNGRERLDVFAKHLRAEHVQQVNAGHDPVFVPITIDYKGVNETYYSYCRTLRVHNFGKQRVVINHRQPDLSDSPVFFNSNRSRWQAKGITRIRRHRWPVEVYHQEGKVEGLDQYQVRDFQAISRHIGLVAVAYSLLRAAPHDTVLLSTLHRQLKLDLAVSAPAWRRSTQAQSLWNLASLILTGFSQGLSLDQVMAPLLAAVCA